jgi:hypothetical protein
MPKSSIYTDLHLDKGLLSAVGEAIEKGNVENAAYESFFTESLELFDAKTQDSLSPGDRIKFFEYIEENWNPDMVEDFKKDGRVKDKAKEKSKNDGKDVEHDDDGREMPSDKKKDGTSKVATGGDIEGDGPSKSGFKVNVGGDSGETKTTANDTDDEKKMDKKPDVIDTDPKNTTKSKGIKEAIDDDSDSGDKNIIMQMKKNITLRGAKPIEFNDGKTSMVNVKTSQAVLRKFNSLKKPMEKMKFQTELGKSKSSFDGLVKTLSESYTSGDPFPQAKEPDFGEVGGDYTVAQAYELGRKSKAGKGRIGDNPFGDEQNSPNVLSRSWMIGFMETNRRVAEDGPNTRTRGNASEPAFDDFDDDEEEDWDIEESVLSEMAKNDDKHTVLEVSESGGACVVCKAMDENSAIDFAENHEPNEGFVVEVHRVSEVRKMTNVVGTEHLNESTDGDAKKKSLDEGRHYEYLNEASRELAKLGSLTFVTDTKGMVYVMHKGKQLFKGDFDRGSSSFWMNWNDGKGQMSFPEADDVLKYLNKNPKLLMTAIKKHDKIGIGESLDESFEMGKVYHIEFKDGERGYFIPQSKQKNGKYSGIQFDQGAAGRSKNKPSKNSYSDDRNWTLTPEKDVPPHIKKHLNEAVIDPREPPIEAKLVNTTYDIGGDKSGHDKGMGYRLKLTFKGHTEYLPDQNIVPFKDFASAKKAIDRIILKHPKGIRKSWVPIVSAAMKKRPVNESTDQYVDYMDNIMYENRGGTQDG